MKKENILQR